MNQPYRYRIRVGANLERAALCNLQRTMHARQGPHPCYQPGVVADRSDDQQFCVRRASPLNEPHDTPEAPGQVSSAEGWTVASTVGEAQFTVSGVSRWHRSNARM